MAKAILIDDYGNYYEGEEEDDEYYYGDSLRGGDGERVDTQNAPDERVEGSPGITDGYTPGGPTPEQIAAAERGTNFEGRSFGQAEADAWIQEALGKGVPQGWIDSFIARNPLDYNRIYEQWLDEQSPNGAANRNPDTSGGGSGGGGGGGGGQSWDDFVGGLGPPPTQAGWMPTYTAPVFTAPPALNLPTWQEPEAFAYGEFHKPTIEEARNEPGFAFAMEEGRKQMEASAGAKGIGRSGGTMKALLGYGQKMGDLNYQNVFNRDKTVYDTNYDTAKGVYDTNYQGAKDTFKYMTDEAQNEYDALWDSTVKKHEFDTSGALDEFGPLKDQAIKNFEAAMEIWKEKMRVAGLIFTSGQDIANFNFSS